MFIFYEDEKDVTRMVNLEEDGEIAIYPIWVNHYGDAYGLIFYNWKENEDYCLAKYPTYDQVSEMLAKIKYAFESRYDYFWMPPFSQKNCIT